MTMSNLHSNLKVKKKKNPLNIANGKYLPYHSHVLSLLLLSLYYTVAHMDDVTVESFLWLFDGYKPSFMQIDVYFVGGSMTKLAMMINKMSQQQNNFVMFLCP